MVLYMLQTPGGAQSTFVVLCIRNEEMCCWDRLSSGVSVMKGDWLSFFASLLKLCRIRKAAWISLLIGKPESISCKWINFVKHVTYVVVVLLVTSKTASYPSVLAAHNSYI
jgi:hypothetical protein